ncbi:MAG: hypothetical protein H0Z34_12455 [Brevibacillus sp.]|nr:hypothetical protein [Brevibacillus sp.]
MKQCWNQRLLEVLEKTYQYDAELMTPQCKQAVDDYRARLDEYRRKIEGRE